MKVVYDISTLAVGHFHPRARTGVHRAVENIALGLRDSAQCELSICAAESYTVARFAQKYLEAIKHFDGVPFVTSGSGVLRVSNPPRPKPIKPLRPLPIVPYLYEHGCRWLDARGLTRNAIDPPFNRLDRRALAGQQIFHSPFSPLPFATLRIKNLKRFQTVYDLIPILFPQWFQFGEDRLIKRVLGRLAPDDWVLSDSQSTKNDLCNYLPQLDPARVVVTPLAASQMFYPCRDEAQQAAARLRYSLPDAPYLLSLSTLEPRKNIAHTVRCFARVVREQKIPDLHLVLVGTKGWDYDQIFESIADVADVKDRIIATGYAADEDLAAIYSGALGFVYPSFYEGFGLPPLEAMQCGVPVITSNTSSLPEVVGDAAIMVDPKSEDELCAAMLDLYQDADLRSRLSQRSLERAKLFSWQKCIDQTLAAYRAALN